MPFGFTPKSRSFIFCKTLSAGLAALALLGMGCSNKSTPSSPGPVPTDTFTPVLTATFTGTSTSTGTPTKTPTPQFTNSPTSTGTATATFSATSSPTLTFTLTPTNSPTVTDTSTSTLTPTNTPTNTFSSTPTNSPTVTDTQTSTNSPTVTDTATITSTPTVTFTPTQTGTPTSTSTPLPHRLITSWGGYDGSGTGAGFFNGPEALAIDNTNSYLYVCDTGSPGGASFLQRFNLSGTYQTQYSGNYPNGAAVDSSGDIYLADGFDNRMIVLNSSGVSQRAWSSWTGGGAGSFSNLRYVAINPSGSATTIFTSDENNSEVDEFTTVGGFIQEINYTTAGSPFTSPTGLAVDSTGNLWVANYGNRSLYKFAPGATSPSTIVSSFNGGTVLVQPQGMGIDPHDNVYVADYGIGGSNGEVYELDKNGNYVYTITGVPGAFDVKSDSSGNIYVVDDASDKVFKFGP